MQNAVTYSPEGSQVRLSAAGGQAAVRIRIEDDGPGVDPDDLPRLMRPFEQGENALTRTAEGAGLGLPIVALLCRAMGGAFQLSTEPGKGLTAEVVLPAA
jgi:signal transduction histidine kinase